MPDFWQLSPGEIMNVTNILLWLRIGQRIEITLLKYIKYIHDVIKTPMVCGRFRKQFEPDTKKAVWNI